MKTKQEIISYIINYIQDNGRAIMPDGKCAYWTNGKMCAVGICLENPKEFEGDTSTTAKRLIEKFGIKKFKKQFRVKNIKFWQDLQQFHDTDKYWESDKSLSKIGIVALIRFKEHTKTTQNKTKLFT